MRGACRTQDIHLIMDRATDFIERCPLIRSIFRVKIHQRRETNERNRREALSAFLFDEISSPE
jgi:hypothetical protein